MGSQQLTLGSLNLVGGTGTGYTFNVEADDATWGNPVPIEVGIRSLLQDGAVVATTGHDNRDPFFFRVRIKGTNSSTLANAESALVAQVGIPTTLTWTPEDGVGLPCVFDVFTSSLEHVFDDLLETVADTRIYGLRLICAPFARPASTTVVAALASAGSLTTTLVDACSSLTGWANTGGGTTFTLPGGTAVQTSRPSGSSFLELTRTSTAINMTASPYLTLRVGFSIATFDFVDVRADGVVLLEVARLRISSGTMTVEDRTYYCPDTSITTITLYGSFDPGSATMYVDNINRSNQVPFTGTARQKARTIAVAGSARTQGSLSIQHATSGLGDVLCYVADDTGTGYRPDLRTRRTAGGTVTADSAQVSGSTEDINTLTTFTIPIADLPAGPYTLMARVAKITTTTARVVTWTAQASFGGTLTGPVITGVANIPSGTAGVWEIRSLGQLVLPTVATPDGSTGNIILTLDSDLGLSFDEGWLFDLDRGALTWAACGTGTPAAGTIHNRMWIDSPTITTPRPGVFIGTTSDKSDSHYPSSLPSWALNLFTPGTINVFTVTTGALDADVALEYYPRYHTHVAA